LNIQVPDVFWGEREFSRKRKFGFINLSVLIVARNIQDKPAGIFISDMMNVIGT
jgi:hypothetical protein